MPVPGSVTHRSESTSTGSLKARSSLALTCVECSGIHGVPCRPCLHVQRLLKSPAVKEGPARNINIFFDGLSGPHFAPPAAVWQHQAVEGEIHCRHSGPKVAASCYLNCAACNHNDMPATFKAYLTILDKLQGPTCSGQLLIRVSLTSIADVKLALVTSEHACMACRRLL